MNNIEELKKAAWDANLDGWVGLEDTLNADGYTEEVSKFIQHCSPSVIITLIAQLEAAQKERDELKEKLSKVITDDWNELGPTYPAHYTPVIVAMNGVTQYITYQIEEGDNGDYWQPVCNEDGEGAPMTQFQHWKPLPADFVVEGNADAE